MPKCGYCGKFLSNVDCVRCSKCANNYHRACCSVPTGTTPQGWACQGCKVKTKPDPTSSSRASKTLCGDMSSEKSTPQSDLSENTPTTNNHMLREFMQEIRDLRSELSKTRTEIADCRREILDFKAELHSCGARLTALEDKVSTLETSCEVKSPGNVEKLENTITELKRQLNEREQESLHNDLEISGLPEEKNENILHVTGLIAVKLGMKLEDRDVVFAERVGFPRRNRAAEDATASLRPRAIVVRLARRALRDDLLRAARVRRGLSSADISMPGEPRRFYVNERLTRLNRQLFGMAREAASRAQWKYVWTRNGNIFARKDDGKVAERIKNENDIKKIFIS
ncbi:unnamed protein product [Parnassius mnemosyne]|uniref:FP protein C-terminal domain-containing protein n=1 Tax=Parnassius mnemosyne TaxID=213953 RepID=A0AAV1LLD8_9NEOP